jgi:rhodanese-related sulfurtransferase
LVFILLIVSNASKGGKKINSQELINLLNQDKAKIIDLRPSSDFSKGHITGSVNMPSNEIENRSHEIKLKDQESLILVCEMGSQSGNTGELLKKQGFNDILILRGGIGQWRIDNLPLI